MTDILPALALGVTSAGLVAAAIAIASLLGLDRRWFGPSRHFSPQAIIDRLAGIADIAKSEGLLVAESHVDPHAEPLLARGLHLAADGTPHQVITADLNERLDRPRPGAAPTSKGLSLLSHVGGFGAAGLLVILLAYRAEPDLTPPGLAAAGFLGFLLLAATGSFSASRSRRRGACAATTMEGTMQIVAASLIATGCDGQTVRGHLVRLLPPSQRPAESIAQAA